MCSFSSSPAPPFLSALSLSFSPFFHSLDDVRVLQPAEEGDLADGGCRHAAPRAGRAGRAQALERDDLARQAVAGLERKRRGGRMRKDRAGGSSGGEERGKERESREASGERSAPAPRRQLRGAPFDPGAGLCPAPRPAPVKGGRSPRCVLPWAGAGGGESGRAEEGGSERPRERPRMENQETLSDPASRLSPPSAAGRTRPTTPRPRSPVLAPQVRQRWGGGRAEGGAHASQLKGSGGATERVSLHSAARRAAPPLSLSTSYLVAGRKGAFS